MTRESHVIFGTAGHVDHGKSSLVLALTGMDPDRLAEEKKREMTIDLGFAFLALPGITAEAAIVDVPGHEMFVRNMVAGATGIDAAIFVVAADEGVMPQTVEHLDILRFLHVSTGVVALTKVDKVPLDRIAEVTHQIANLIAGGFLEGAKVIPVSSLTGEGVTALKEELARLALLVGNRSVEGVFRLPIDRAFTIKGAGTVVTGTVISGSLKTDETVVCLPQGQLLRVRGLQVHDAPVSNILAGQRAAINLAAVAKAALHRGDVLATPGALEPTLMVDARVTLSAKALRPLEQRTRVRLHHGTTETMARVVPLEADLLMPGESGLIQLRLEAPLVAAAGDLFVLRSYSPMFVIGGGTILDPHPSKRRRRDGAEDIARREQLPPEEIVIECLDRSTKKGMEFAKLRVLTSFSEGSLRTLLANAVAEKQVFAGYRDVWYSAAAVKDMQVSIMAQLAGLHGAEPLRRTVPLNKLLARTASAPDKRECFRIALDLLRTEGVVEVEGERVRLSSHNPQWAGRFARARESILQMCLSGGLSVPDVNQLAAAAALTEKDCERVIVALMDSGEILRLSDGIYVHAGVFDEGRSKVRDFLRRNEKMTIAQARDLLNASRKYLLPFLEELDRQGVTVRQGDFRTLRDV